MIIISHVKSTVSFQISFWILYAAPSTSGRLASSPFGATVAVLLATSWRMSLEEGFPGVSDGRESAHNAGNLRSIPGSGRYAGKGNGNPLQYSCQENSMDRGAWWATVHGGREESDTIEKLIYILIGYVLNQRT